MRKHSKPTTLPLGTISERTLLISHVVLVYQAGIANVFDISGDKHQRIYQGDFRTAENIAYGLGLAGATVELAACNMAGDIATQCWTTDLESQPFSESFRGRAMKDGKVTRAAFTVTEDE